MGSTFSTPRKIFIGLNNICNMIPDYRRGFELHGIECLTATDLVSSARGDPIDFIVENLTPKQDHYKSELFSDLFIKTHQAEALSFVRQKAIRECDTFFFIWRSFEEDFSDLAELKSQGKKIICLFNGDDVRWWPAMEQEHFAHRMHKILYERDYYGIVNCEMQLKKLRNAERYADLIIANRNTMQLALRPHLSHWIPIPERLIRSDPRPQRQKRPLVIHAPTSRAFKGSDHVIATFERLEWDNIDAEFKLIEGLPHSEALRLYEECDVLVDQLLASGGGKVGLEALALGKVVVSHMNPNYQQPFCSGSPIVNATVETLYDTLKRLIEDHNHRAEIARIGPLYINEFHTPRKTCADVLNYLCNPRLPLDNIPKFFRDSYKPRHKEEAQLCNEFTKLVRNEPWFTSTVAPGERSMLRF